MYRTLVLHSAFFPGEIRLDETSIFSKSTRAYRFLHRRDRALYQYMMENDKLWDEFVSSIRAVATLQHALRPLHTRLSMTPSLWRLIGAGYVAEKFFDIASHARKARIVEKTPHHLKYVNHIFQVFADARVIVMIRHPLDVFTSYRRRYKAEQKLNDGNPDWFDRTPEDFTHQYRDNLKLIVEAKNKYTNQFRVVKYEDFTSHPENVFRRICSFVEIDFEAGPLKGEHGSLAGYKPDPHLARPITQDTKRWQDYISMDHARYIEQSLLDSLDQFDYQPKVTSVAS